MEYATAKAQGADEQAVKAAQEKLKRADEKLDRFEKETGRRRRREREYGAAIGNQVKRQAPGVLLYLDAYKKFENRVIPA